MFTKLSMHIDVAPAMAAGRRRTAQQQWQGEPDDVWEEEMTEVRSEEEERGGLSEEEVGLSEEERVGGGRGEDRDRRWTKGAWLTDD